MVLYFPNDLWADEFGQEDELAETQVTRSCSWVLRNEWQLIIHYLIKLFLPYSIFSKTSLWRPQMTWRKADHVILVMIIHSRWVNYHQSWSKRTYTELLHQIVAQLLFASKQTYTSWYSSMCWICIYICQKNPNKGDYEKLRQRVITYLKNTVHLPLIDTMIKQDSTSVIQLERNGWKSISRRTD